MLIMNLPEFEEEKCVYSRGTTEPHWDVDTAKLKSYITCIFLTSP